MGREHARAICESVESARLVGVVDPSPASRSAACEVCPQAAEFESLESALAADSIDVVHVCTPPETHEAVATQALEAGCHVYVEKPFAPTALAAQRILELAAEKGLEVCAGHQVLYEPPARQLFEDVDALGGLVHLESYFSFRAVRRDPQTGALQSPDLQLIDILPHPTYLLLAFLGVASEGPAEIRSVELGPGATVHALIRRGAVTGSLTVTLDGRPVESQVRLVGKNGTLEADFVRGTATRLVGPGASGIDKVLNPYRRAGQLLVGTTGALTRRLLRRSRSYPGLPQLIGAFYGSIRDGSRSPISAVQILETVQVCEEISRALTAAAAPSKPPLSRPNVPRVLVTGGTGFLGKRVTSALVASGANVRVLCRRRPVSWEEVPGAEYLTANLARSCPAQALRDVDIVVNCAAATSGGWSQHQENSIGAVENVLQAAATARVSRMIHISSLAVLARGREPISESTPVEPEPRRRGPYVWGKTESEKRALELAKQLAVEVKVIRPGALVDYKQFDAPGLLGRRVGNLFVAVGGRKERLGIVDVDFAADTITWLARHFERAPDELNLLQPELPTKRDLVARLKRRNQGLRVVWLPRLLLSPLSLLALGLQQVLRPGQPAVNVARVFAKSRYDTSLISRVSAEMEELRDAARAGSAGRDGGLLGVRDSPVQTT